MRLHGMLQSQRTLDSLNSEYRLVSFAILFLTLFVVYLLNILPGLYLDVWLCFLTTYAEDKIFLYCIEACTVLFFIVKALLMFGSAVEERRSADESYKSSLGLCMRQTCLFSSSHPTPTLEGRRKLWLFGVLSFEGYLLSRSSGRLCWKSFLSSFENCFKRQNRHLQTILELFIHDCSVLFSVKDS